MIYGSEPTQPLHDRSSAPRESLPYVSALMWDDRLSGAAGRKVLRKALGPEHEKSDMDIPGLRGFPVWRFVLKNGAVLPAPSGTDTTDLPTVYILGPTAKNFLSVSATARTTGSEAAQILEHLCKILGVTHSR